MEQATNSFNKGLLMDTHPMILGNDTMTDCLNGTLITMNGNEIILLNDMGNRKVDKAFLHAGYEPVGMKEYGGIIYVAAYNPITNRSQIGSFPSPELYMSDPDDSTSEIIPINGSPFSRLYKLTDNILHPGDSFLIYEKSIEIDSNNVSNYDNIHRDNNHIDKVKSPKNKTYTYSIGILNSLNLFVDITSSLKRYDTNGKIITFGNNESELYKFNCGYFIPKLTPELSTNIDDKLLNIYSHKLVGPLYLKIQINHVLNFTYLIEDAIIEETLNNNGSISKKLTFNVVGTLTYNCPDGYDLSNSNNIPAGDDTYYTYENGEVRDSDIFGFDVIEKAEVNGININNQISHPASEVTYNKETNLYQTSITKSYEIDITNKPKIDYIVRVKSPIPVTTKNNVTTSTYIDELEDTGTINTNLIGTDKAKIIGWRYTYDDGDILLTYSLETYLNSSKTYSDVEFIFTDILDNSTTHTLSDKYSLASGRRTIKFNINDFNNPLNPRHLYKVLLSYTVNGTSMTIDPRWILTTSLFNDCYNKVSDYLYKTTMDEYPPEIKNKLTLDLDSEIITNLILQSNSLSITGNLFTGNLITYTHSTTLNYLLLHNALVILRDMYPSYLSLSNTTLSPLLGQDSYQHEYVDFNDNTPNNDRVLKSSSNLGLNNITLTIIDKFEGASSAQDMNIVKAFDSINNCRDIVIGTPSYSGMYIHPTGNDVHFKRCINYTKDTIDIGENYDHFTDGEEIEGHRILNFNDSMMSRFYFEIFNSINLSCNFAYLFTSDDSKLDHSTESTYCNGYYNTQGTDIGFPTSTDRNPLNYSKLWWRNNNHEWTLVRGLINKSGVNLSIIDTAFGTTGRNYIYCVYNNYNGSEIIKKPSLNSCSEYYKDKVKCKIKFYTVVNDGPGGLTLSSTTVDSTPIINNNSNNPLRFNLNSNGYDFYKEIEIPVESSLGFYDDVQKALSGTIDGIELTTKQIRDINGNLLSRILIYKKDTNNKLVPISVPLVVETKTPNTDYNILLCIPTNGAIGSTYPYLLSTNSNSKGGIAFYDGMITTIGNNDFNA